MLFYPLYTRLFPFVLSLDSFKYSIPEYNGRSFEAFGINKFDSRPRSILDCKPYNLPFFFESYFNLIPCSFWQLNFCHIQFRHISDLFDWLLFVVEMLLNLTLRRPGICLVEDISLACFRIQIRSQLATHFHIALVLLAYICLFVFVPSQKGVVW